MMKNKHYLIIAGVLGFFIARPQGKWTQKASLPGAGWRTAAIAFSIGSKGYAGTGSDSISLFKKDFWEWDQATNTWAQKADFGGTSRNSAVGFAIGSKGYIGTGYTGGDHCNDCLKDFWEYDQATNAWLQKAYLNTGREHAVGFSIGNKGYIGTGGTPEAAVDFWEWNQATNTWAQKANFAGPPRVDAVAFSIGNKGYIGTGSHTWEYNDFWEWDQATNTWTQKSDFPGTPRDRAVGFSIGNKGYIGTGSDGNGPLDFWEWDLATDTWTRKADFTGSPRSDAIGFSIGNFGYIGTGYLTNDFWEFYPHAISVEINESDRKDTLIIYPNPAEKLISISSTGTSKNILEIIIKNDMGQVIYQASKEAENNHLIDLSHHQPGIYFIEIQQGNTHRVEKVVLE